MTARIEQTSLAGASTGARARSISLAQLEKLCAPFALRCGAMLVDYTLLIVIVAFSTLIARLLGGSARMAGGAAESLGRLIALGLTLLNFIVLGGLTGQTLGKWATGLRIERTNGGTPGILRSLLRHLIGYPLSLIIFGLGFLLAAFDSQGRALHDYLSGTIVVRDVQKRGGSAR
jgi:uncharacterized RDD family membrane protein YckC